MFPVLSTRTQVELAVQAIELRLVVPSMSCFVAVASPLPLITRLRTFPAPSMARHAVVEVQTTPLSALVPSTSVSFHVEDSIWVVLVAMCMWPVLSARAQKDVDKQKLPLMFAVPWSSRVQDVDAGLVE